MEELCMTIDLTIKIGGAAGQGIQTVGELLTQACHGAGYYIMGINDFESRIRGGHSFFQLRIRDVPVAAPDHEVDLLIALNRESWDLHCSQLRPGGIALVGEEGELDDDRAFHISFSKIAEEAGSKLYANTVAAAAAFSLLGGTFEMTRSVLAGHFTGKKEKLLEKNLLAARMGYDAVEEIAFEPDPLARTSKPRGEVMPGSLALSRGAVAADCRVAAFYPMSPATSIMGHLAGWTDRLPLVVEQAEDEIAAVNMIIGAAFAGVRAMTSTSGGGFCLMAEGLGLAAITETPIVIVNAQRPGPATGLPTRTAQGDLGFVIHASQDDFPRFVFAPGMPEEAFEVTRKAFDLSEKYQVPAIILVDQYLADSLYCVETPMAAPGKVERYIATDDDIDNPSSYHRYAVTPSGISPRVLPCRGDALVVVSSDEHREDGHMSETMEHRNAMMTKRHAKLPAMTREMDGPEGDFTEARTLLLGWGSTAGALKEAVEQLRKTGLDVGCLLFTDLWPFPAEKTEIALSSAERIITVEQNISGQFGRLLRAETGISPDDSVLKFDGRPFTANDIVQAVQTMEND
jgi:2-oxoglutarate ferredoxin oxidoreductase subunit alpha